MEEDINWNDKTLFGSISKFSNTDNSNWFKILPFVRLPHNSADCKFFQFSTHYLDINLHF